MESIANSIQGLVMNLIVAAAIFFIGKYIAKSISEIVAKTMARRDTDPALIGFVKSLLHWALLGFVAIAALGQLGIQTASFVAIIGAAGLAVGLALQGSLSNFAAGVLLLIFRPFKIGDFVELAGTAGTVVSIQIFTTELVTPDNKQIIVPNASATGGTITNVSALPTRRVDMVFGIGYSDDIDKARDLILDILNSDSRVLKDPEAQVAVAELADSSVNFVTRPWVNAADYWGVKFDVTEQVKKRFDAEGISIPFPQQDVHMHQAGD